jgi:hypothetical protein
MTSNSDELRNELKDLQSAFADSLGDMYLTDTHIEWLVPYITAYANKARLDQIMKDFLKYSLCTDVDEALLIDIQKSLEAELTEKEEQ